MKLASVSFLLVTLATGLVSGLPQSNGAGVAHLSKRSGLNTPNALAKRDVLECFDEDAGPSIDDCNKLVSQISEFGSENFNISPENPINFDYGSCKATIQSECDTWTISGSGIADVLQNVISGCVNEGKSGAVLDSDGNNTGNHQAGLFPSGEELPPYPYECSA
ncbi:hypothetical protein L228DRAFT_263161 [Xylona heveae TC161]|uniref:Ecp2 effector protein domain-containing protein n=1 Tax=Xylona heveae (strain CBS 132557 / TC161) TaxID=1328760 RepID=A0A165A189_XYLHT|nr:hypothetical protein L228DRAFT_263161 [Xylona heveae TC161]KZF19812.1 hypothetical protein L228DRAFT_263161 [Xylona heveae TC161]